MAPKSHILSLPELRARLQDVDQQLALIQERLQTAPVDEQAGLFAHQVSLQHKRHWYIARIRAQVPVQALSVEAHERIKTGDGIG